jgi:hypothetical protein
LPRIPVFIDDDAGDFQYEADEPVRTRQQSKERRSGPPPARPRRAPDGSEAFKCGHCRAFIGPTITGGRFRNHCPLCLYSRHVDRSHPGDRASDCRALMAPVGVTTRPNGEQMIVHRCLGCGAERRNRVAADDNIVACMRLAPVKPAARKETDKEERIA